MILNFNRSEMPHSNFNIVRNLMVNFKPGEHMRKMFCFFFCHMELGRNNPRNHKRIQTNDLLAPVA